MAKLDAFDITLEIKIEGGNLQTLVDICRAARLYMDTATGAAAQFSPACLAAMQEMAAEIEASSGEAFTAIQNIRVQPVMLRRGLKS